MSRFWQSGRCPHKTNRQYWSTLLAEIIMVSVLMESFFSRPRVKKVLVILLPHVNRRCNRIVQGSICGGNGACSVLSMGALAIYILSAADIYLLYQLALNERNAAMLNDLQALR